MAKATYSENALYVMFNDYTNLRAHYGSIVDTIRNDKTQYPHLGPSWERREHTKKLYAEMVAIKLQDLKDMEQTTEEIMNETLELYVVRNDDNEYLQIDFDTEEIHWVEYSEASWMDSFDAEWYNQEDNEIVEIV